MDHQTLGALIRENREELKDRIIARQPHLFDHYNSEQIKRCKEDILYHLMYLAEAIAVDDIPLFEEYQDWVRTLFEELNISIEKTEKNLEVTGEVIATAYPGTEEILSPFIEAGLKRLSSPSSLKVFLPKDNPYYKLADSYLTSLLQGDRHESLSLILSSVEEGVDIKDLYIHVFQPVLHRVGYLWQLKRISVAREHYCTATTQLIMSHLYPYILNPSTEEGCRCITLCVSGELHELGIRMVADLLEMDGWDTTHLGANTPLSGVLEMIEEREAHLLAVSATLTIHLNHVRELITAIEKASLPVKVMVGGYPFNASKDLWRKVGAHAYAPNALEAIAVAKATIDDC